MQLLKSLTAKLGRFYPMRSKISHFTFLDSPRSFTTHVAYHDRDNKHNSERPIRVHVERCKENFAMAKSPKCVTKRVLSFSVGMPYAVVTFLSQRLLLFVEMITSIFNMEMKGLTTCFVLCQYRGVDLRVISKVCIDTSSSFRYQISNWITWPLLKEWKKVVNYLVNYIEIWSLVYEFFSSLKMQKLMNNA